MKRTFALLALSAAVFVGCAPRHGDDRPASGRTEDDLISYAHNDRVTVSREPVAFPYDAASFEAMVATCNTTIDPQRVKDIEAAFADTQGVVYRFAYRGDVEDPSTFDVSVFPNALPYADIKEFQNDFGPCAPGGRYYPHALSARSVLFVASCGAGPAEKSDEPHGCDAAKRAVERSIVAL